MKKIISMLLVAVMLLAFAACSGSGEIPVPDVKTDVDVVALKGPTGMGMVKLMEEDASVYNNYNFTLAAAPTEIVGLISNGSADIAACPLNLAATLYKKTQGAVQIIAVNTLGTLYILENGSTVTDVASLKGKTIYASGQGATPEYVLNYLLEKNGIDKEKDVEIIWKAEHAEVATLMASGEAEICLLPEPNVTAVQLQNADTRIALDMTKEWEKVAEGKLAMGCLIATKEYIDNNADSLKAFLKEYSASVDAVNENTDEICSLIAEKGIVPKAPVAKKAIPNCNIVCITGNEMKDIAKSNFDMLFNADPKSIGGELPNESIYFIAE